MPIQRAGLLIRQFLSTYTPPILIDVYAITDIKPRRECPNSDEVAEAYAKEMLYGISVGFNSLDWIVRH
jgi:hypothetical protein